MRKTSRRNCTRPHSPISISPQAVRTANTIVDTPRRARLIHDAHTTAGKLPRRELFQIHNINIRTGYRILHSGLARRGPGVHNRGRKPVLAPFEREAIEQSRIPHSAQQLPLITRTRPLLV